VVQAPVDGLHVPATWQASTGAQEAVEPPQTPFAHLSAIVQALLSLHALPLVLADGPHVPVEPHA
jgi:hypothetical protein